jgi:hypothetical protein
MFFLWASRMMMMRFHRDSHVHKILYAWKRRYTKKRGLES